MYTKEFWLAALTRTVRTFAQALAGSIAAGASLFGLDWKGILGVAGATALAAFLTAVAGPGQLGEVAIDPE